MSGRVVVFVQQGSFEAAFQVTTLAVTAAAMGDEVILVFAFDALKLLVRKSFGKPHSEKELAESARSEGLGVPSPAALLDEARGLGAKLYACDTTVKVCGVALKEAEAVLDEVMGLASLWRLTEGARILSF